MFLVVMLVAPAVEETVWVTVGMGKEEGGEKGRDEGGKYTRGRNG